MELFKQKQKISTQKWDYKKLTLHKWNTFIKWFTHTYYFMLYNTLFGYGWSGVVHNAMTNSDWLHQGQNYTILIGFGIGHGVCLIGQGIATWFHRKAKVDKQFLDDNNTEIIKIRKTGLLFVVIGLIPIFVWLLGRIILMFVFRKYKLAHNGTYKRACNEIVEKEVVDNMAIDKASEIVGKALKNIK